MRTRVRSVSGPPPSARRRRRFRRSPRLRIAAAARDHPELRLSGVPVHPGSGEGVLGEHLHAVHLEHRRAPVVARHLDAAALADRAQAVEDRRALRVVHVAHDHRRSLLPRRDAVEVPARQVLLLRGRRVDPARRVQPDRHHRRVHADRRDPDALDRRVFQRLHVRLRRRRVRGRLGDLRPDRRRGRSSDRRRCGGLRRSGVDIGSVAHHGEAGEHDQRDGAPGGASSRRPLTLVLGHGSPFPTRGSRPAFHSHPCTPYFTHAKAVRAGRRSGKGERVVGPEGVRPSR